MSIRQGSEVRSQSEFDSWSPEQFSSAASASVFFPVTFFLLHHGIVQVVFLFSGDLS